MTIRIYQQQPLTAHSIYELDAAGSHHLARVLRAAVGEPVVLFNGLGGEYHGIIQEISKKTVRVEIQEHVQREAESMLDICLAQGISRGEKMDYTIQKAVELGIKRIVPLFTERCNVKLDSERSEKRLQHWQSIIISACEQSGRNYIPTIEAPQTLNKWLTQVKVDYGFVLSPHATDKLTKTTIPPTAKIALLIGPEGGLTGKEIAQAISFQPLNLGPRILRTETAAVAAITAIQCCFGDMGGF